MHDILFRYALLPISEASNTTEWMIDDSNRLYTTIDFLDFLDLSENLGEKVFSLYKKAYARYKSDPKVKTPEEFAKYQRCILFYEDNDPNKEPVIFSFIKVTPAGLKVCFSGRNDTPSTKAPFSKFSINSLNTPGIYSEISKAIYRASQGQIPVVDFSTAQNILFRLGKKDIQEEKNNYYSREIVPIGRVTKIMVGFPLP